MDGYVWSVSIGKMSVANKLNLSDKEVLEYAMNRAGLIEWVREF